MPRRSGGRSAPRPSPVARDQVRDPPKPVAAAHAPAPAPAPVQGGGFRAAVADGLAWGMGNAVAHRAADAVMGPRVIQHETVTSSAPAAAPVSTPSNNNFAGAEACGGQSKALQECLSKYGSDISKCQFYMDMLQECRRSSASALSA